MCVFSTFYCFIAVFFFFWKWQSYAAGQQVGRLVPAGWSVDASLGLSFLFAGTVTSDSITFEIRFCSFFEVLFYEGGMRMEGFEVVRLQLDFTEESSWTWRHRYICKKSFISSCFLIFLDHKTFFNCLINSNLRICVCLICCWLDLIDIWGVWGDGLNRFVDEIRKLKLSRCIIFGDYVSRGFCHRHIRPLPPFPIPPDDNWLWLRHYFAILPIIIIL